MRTIDCCPAIRATGWYIYLTASLVCCQCLRTTLYLRMGMCLLGRLYCKSSLSLSLSLCVSYSPTSPLLLHWHVFSIHRKHSIFCHRAPAEACCSVWHHILCLFRGPG
jgi:hypothetical protein